MGNTESWLFVTLQASNCYATTLNHTQAEVGSVTHRTWIFSKSYPPTLADFPSQRTATAKYAGPQKHTASCLKAPAIQETICLGIEGFNSIHNQAARSREAGGLWLMRNSVLPLRNGRIHPCNGQNQIGLLYPLVVPSPERSFTAVVVLCNPASSEQLEDVRKEANPSILT